MCGRYTLKASPEDVAEHFGLPEVPDLLPRYNVAPTQMVPAVKMTPDGRALTMLKWGLVPSWADDPGIGSRMINARGETVAEKPAYRSAFKQRRCLLPGDGFFEWKPEGKVKQPWHFRLKDGGPYAFAGLYEHWSKDGRTVDSCTLITGEPNDLVRPIHDRMPVILPSDRYEEWLDPENKHTEGLLRLLKPYDARKMVAYPVDRIVSKAGVDNPQCVEPLE